MKYKIIKLISEITFWAGIGLSAVSIFILVSSSVSLPARNCPINSGRPFMTVTVAVLVVSFITSLFKHKNKSKNVKNKN